MSQYPDKAFDIAIVDPQTGQGEGKNHQTRDNLVKTNHRVLDWDSIPPCEAYWKELFRVSRYQIIMCENWLDFPQKGSSPGRIVWNLLRDNDFSSCNIMWTNLFGRIDYFEFLWNGMIQGIRVNDRTQQGNKHLNQKRIHPSEKPYMVYNHLFKSYVKPGWSVLDTHLGSGASRIVADKLGIDFYSCEINEQIFNDQEQRFARHRNNLFAENISLPEIAKP